MHPGLHPACHLCLLQPPDRKGSESTHRVPPCGHGSACGFLCVTHPVGARGPPGQAGGDRAPVSLLSFVFPLRVTMSVLHPLSQGETHMLYMHL